MTILDQTGKPADLKEFIAIWNSLSNAGRRPENDVELAFYSAISVVQHMSMSNPLFICVALWYFSRLLDSMAPQVFGDTATTVIAESTQGLRDILMPILYNFWAAGKEEGNDNAEDGGRSEAGSEGLQEAEQRPAKGSPILDGTFVGS